MVKIRRHTLATARRRFTFMRYFAGHAEGARVRTGDFSLFARMEIDAMMMGIRRWLQ